MTQSHIPHTRLNPAHPARAQPKPRSPAHIPIPDPPRQMPAVDYILRPRPLPISGAFPPDQINTLIDQLKDPRHREIITMRYVQGYQWGTIADVMAYDRTAVWRLEKAAIAELNNALRRKIVWQTPATKRPLSTPALLGIGLLGGVVLAAVLWWLVDTALMRSTARPGTTWLTDLNTAKVWMIGLYCLGVVQGFFAGRQCERRPKAQTGGGEPKHVNRPASC